MARAPAPPLRPGPAPHVGAAWTALRRAAETAGLTVARVVDRERVEPAFRPHAHLGATPARMHPGYRRAVVLGAGGRRFWERFRAAHRAAPDPAADPLDRYTVGVIEGLLAEWRRHDPSAVDAYPFRHPRQLLPFPALVASLPALQVRPFGVAVDAVHGPWFAWRAVVLTRLPLPESPVPAEAPCADCAAPCVPACPVGAVDPAGFRWRDCVSYRHAGRGCQDACLARNACPVGAGSRYGADQTAYHYRASLRMIRVRSGEAPPATHPPNHH